jgi:sulfite reductase alpha subunit-like flavoprotein
LLLHLQSLQTRRFLAHICIDQLADTFRNGIHQVGDKILVSRKAVGTLVVDDLKPAPNLFLFGTGTGLAPFRAMGLDAAASGAPVGEQMGGFMP